MKLLLIAKLIVLATLASLSNTIKVGEIINGQVFMTISQSDLNQVASEVFNKAGVSKSTVAEIDGRYYLFAKEDGVYTAGVEVDIDNKDINPSITIGGQNYKELHECSGSCANCSIKITNGEIDACTACHIYFVCNHTVVYTPVDVITLTTQITAYPTRYDVSEFVSISNEGN